VYHSGNLPSNAKDTAGIVAGPGAAGKVYISNSSGAPTWDTYDTTVTSGSSHLVTSGAVYTAIANNVASAVQYLGTVASEADIIALTDAGQGDFARVTSSFTFTDASGSSVTAHVGDVVYLTNNTPGTAANWLVAHTEIDTDTWTAASTSAAGYIPQLTTGGAALASSSNDYVLSFVNGTNTTPVWRKLPANAYKDTWIAWKGATDSVAGTAGYMPGAASADRGKYLRGDGSWVALSETSHTHSVKINGSTKTIAAPGGTAVDLGSYLPLSGGTMKGDITFDLFDNGINWNIKTLISWARDFITFNQYASNDSSSPLSTVFRIGSYGGTSGNIYSYIGTGGYDSSINLRFYKNGSICIGSNIVAHAGNISNKAAVIGTTATTLATIAGVSITA
jgi:hypothetical protein